MKKAGGEGGGKGRPRRSYERRETGSKRRERQVLDRGLRERKQEITGGGCS